MFSFSISLSHTLIIALKSEDPHISSILALFNSTGNMIVELHNDGSVTWDNEIDISEAAKALTEVLTLTAEQRAGVSTNVKLKMRDSVFNDLIQIAKEKGSLSAEDLTYYLEASKIVEKLKGE